MTAVGIRLSSRLLLLSPVVLRLGDVGERVWIDVWMEEWMDWVDEREGRDWISVESGPREWSVSEWACARIDAADGRSRPEWGIA